MFGLKVGCDPEVFVRDVKTKAFISAHGLCPGTKAQPHTVPGGALQVDGLALEYNINAASTEDEFVDLNHRVMRHLRDRVAIKSRDYAICIAPVAHFDGKYFASLPEESKVLGCDKDYDAYTEKVKETPDLMDKPVRMASGHIHVGWIEDCDDVDPLEPEHFKVCCDFVRQLDRILGIPSFMWDNNKKRRKYYGSLGTFRPKKYGVEYRVLSNQWLKSDLLMRHVYKCVKDAAYDYNNDFNYFDCFPDEYLHEIHEKLMNETDPAVIKAIVEDYLETNQWLPKPPEVKNA